MLVVVALFPIALIVAKVRACAAQGSSGPDAGEVAMVDYIARGGGNLARGGV